MLEFLTGPVLAALAMFGFVVVSDPQTLHFESVSAPDALVSAGYSERVLTTRLSAAVQRIEAQARSFPDARQLAADAAPTTLRVLTENLGATPSVRATQKALGWVGFSVAGDIVAQGGGLQLTLRVVVADGASHIILVSAPADGVDRLIEDAALAVVGLADPYVRAAWQLRQDFAAGGDFTATRAVLKGMEQPSRWVDPRWAANLNGVVAFRENRVEDALRQFEQAINLDGFFSPALLNRGVVLASLGLHRDAIEHFRKVLESPKGGAYGPIHAAAYCEWGVSLAALRQIAAARQSFEYATQTDPDYADAYVKWAQVLRAARQDREAAAVLKQRDPASLRPQLYPEYLTGPLGNDAYQMATGVMTQPAEPRP